MQRKQLQKMYSELSTWFEHNIEADILNKDMRPEYQELVNEQRALDVPEDEIPQKVLWSIRAKLQTQPSKPQGLRAIIDRLSVWFTVKLYKFKDLMGFK